MTSSLEDRARLIAMCIELRGWRQGVSLAEFISEWELCVRSVGRAVTIEEFAAWWRDSPRTAYRRLADFRQTFPALGPKGLPSDLMLPLLERLELGQKAADVPPVAYALAP